MIGGFIFAFLFRWFLWGPQRARKRIETILRKLALNSLTASRLVLASAETSCMTAKQAPRLATSPIDIENFSLALCGGGKCAEPYRRARAVRYSSPDTSLPDLHFPALGRTFYTLALQEIKICALYVHIVVSSRAARFGTSSCTLFPSLSLCSVLLLTLLLGT
jgi:hypothetical protein